MAYQTGDSPAEPLTITPYSVDPAAYVTATAQLTMPDYSLATAPQATINGDDIIVDFGALVFDQAGIWSLSVELDAADTGRSRRLPPVRFVVEDADPVQAWHTLSSAREADWPDAREMSDMTLYELLETARHDVIEFAPVLAEGQPIPPSYRMAQLAHARNRWNAALADPGTGDIGGEGFAIPARPLDWQIKQLLRPSRGIPAGF